MSNSLARAAEDLEDYESFYKYWELKPRKSPRHLYFDMYSHYSELCKKLGVENIYQFNQKVAKLKKEGWTKEAIKDFYNLT